MQTIGALAIAEVQKFKDASVQITNGGSFNQHKNIERINKYIRGEFMECPDPTAIFWQLNTQRIPLYAKSIDADTKDFEMYGIGKFNWFKAFIANARFKKWARDEGFALTLDDTSDGIARYGSIVWKKSFDSKGKVELSASNLQNLYFDPTVKNIIETPVVEIHYLTETAIRNRWPDKAVEIIEKAKEARDEDNNQAESEDEKFRIYERWGEFKEEETDKIKYFHWIGTGSGDNEVEIVKDEIKIVDGKPKDFPYFDFHGERIPGRWQGLGVVERLFGIQEQANTLVNQNAQTNEIASLLLFRTADADTNGNILDVDTGQILQSQDLQQLPIDNRFISTFINQLQIIERQADALCFINDSISGDTPPSGVPFRSLAVATRAAASTFKYIRTSMQEKMGIVLEREIMPDVVKDFNKEDIFNIMEDDIDIRLYDQMKIEEGLMKFQKGKAVVFEEDLLAEAQRIQKQLDRGGRNENINIDFTWGVRTNVSGESIDKNIKNAAIDAAIQDMMANPAIVNTPLYKEKLSLNGIPPFRLSPAEQQEIQQGSTGQQPQQEQGVDKLSELAEV